MPDRQVAASADPLQNGQGTAASGHRSRWAAAGRLLSGRPVRWGFVAVTVGLGGYAVAREWPGVRSALASIGVGTTIEALLCVLAALVMTMQLWRLLLAGLGSPLPARAASRIMFIGQLGKYLPGSVWPVLAQMELGNAYRVPRHRSAAASVLTMVVSLLTGLLAALATLPFVAGATAYLWAFAITPVLLACLHPRVLNAVVGRLLRLTRRPPLDLPLTGRAMAAALAWSWSSWVLYGLQIWFLATRLGAPPGRTVLLAIGGFAFAWSVGFLVVLAPAGAGVRDVLLIATLSPVLGTSRATAVALMSRALMTAGDLLTAALAAVSSRPPSPLGRTPGSPEPGSPEPGSPAPESRE
ncbi:MAG: lysylphosphatidylglycerol synthase domain-containing protein [Streptosporangiaceae bacterium]